MSTAALTLEAAREDGRFRRFLRLRNKRREFFITPAEGSTGVVIGIYAVTDDCECIHRIGSVVGDGRPGLLGGDIFYSDCFLAVSDEERDLFTAWLDGLFGPIPPA